MGRSLLVESIGMGRSLLVESIGMGRSLSAVHCREHWYG